MKLARYLALAIAIEGLTIGVLVGIVAVFGPTDPESSALFAQRLGYWVGPLAGFGLCLAGGWFVAQRVDRRHVVHGLALGVLVAAIDTALLVGGGAPFEPVFVVSNLGRMVAGSAGGWLAGRSS
ncbi:MAG: hypothetical protein OEN56_15470 [Gemmatimonadota bacterium]|nr:hypothetical protein [Gemmatimonadota bacterium]